MRQLWFGSGILTVCLLVCSHLAEGCDWDQSVGETQSLDPVALASLSLGSAGNLDRDSCRASCCNRSDCDLVVVTSLRDSGSVQCVLVKCWLQGRDQCVLQPRTDPQVVVYRKKDPETRSTQTGTEETLHVVPLLLEPRDAKTSDSTCRQQVKVGPCRAAFPRFFYNVTEQRCSSFIYGGCDGNGNNFNSEEECDRSCSGVTGPVLLDDPTSAPGEPSAKAPRMAPALDSESSSQQFAELCTVDPEVGPCRAAFPRWFYNRRTGSCETFVYGGCQGNKNNYDSRESCLSTCTVTVLPSAKRPSDGVPAEVEERCKAKPDAGPCRAAFPRWFYDQRTGSCETFVYGGCRGNHNNYDSRESCLSTCTGHFDSHGEHRSERTAAFFLFITLAIVSALLLLVLVIVSVRRRRHARRSSVSDKQELLPEDSRSSLESLSVPGRA